MTKIHADAPVRDSSPNLYVTHCIRIPNGGWALLMWHARDHRIYAFSSDQGIAKIRGLEEEFMTYEEACSRLEDVLTVIPESVG